MQIGLTDYSKLPASAIVLLFLFSFKSVFTVLQLYFKVPYFPVPAWPAVCYSFVKMCKF